MATTSRIRILSISAALLAGAAASCRSAPSAPDPRPIAEDPVCKFYGELGCVKVRVDASTPSATHDGIVYYFCGDDCRDEFVKNPAKFLGTR